MSGMRKGEWTPNTIGASKLTTFRQCPRMFFYQYEMQLVRVREEGARRFGTMLHSGLEAWWRARAVVPVERPPWEEEPLECVGLDKDEALVRAIKAINENAKHFETDPFEEAKAKALSIVYHGRYVDETAFEPLAIEEFFRVPLLDPEGVQFDASWSVVGKKDALVRWGAKRRPTVVEHKHTTSDIEATADYWRRLVLDSQISIYVDAANQLGFETWDIVYDVIRAPKLEPKKRTADERMMTQGKKCSMCEGKGTRKVDNSKCEKCDGDGWHRTKDGKVEAPRLRADARAADETPEEYTARIMDEVAGDPDKYMRRGELTRTPDDIRDVRADLCAAVEEIELNRKRRYWPRNTNACLSIYGRRCDYLDICSREASPESKLYTIRKKGS
jgi:hypothetical protein